MPKPKKLRLRGAEFERVQMDVLSDGSCIVNSDIRCDITPEMATEMAWEIYTKLPPDPTTGEGKFGHLIGGLRSQTNLVGEIELEQVQLKLNGTSGLALECVASKAHDFHLTRKKDDSAGGTITTLQAGVESVGTHHEVLRKHGESGRRADPLPASRANQD